LTIIYCDGYKSRNGFVGLATDLNEIKIIHSGAFNVHVKNSLTGSR
jgi:hypothetical protein